MSYAKPWSTTCSLFSNPRPLFEEIYMYKKVLQVCLYAGAMTFATAGQAAVVDNFDSYAEGSSLASNGYTQFGGGFSIVYPDTTGSGLTDPPFPPLEGTQSVYVGSSQFDARGWGAASSEVGDGATLSVLVKQETAAASGQTQFYLSGNAGIGGGGSAAGIFLDHATGLINLFGTAETPTAFAYTPGSVYLLEMELDFTTDSFVGYATDVTGAGPRTLLGSQAFGVALDAVTTASDGGILLGNANSGSAAFWDDVQITIPEPASLTLVGLGALIMVSRRRLH